LADTALENQLDKLEDNDEDFEVVEVEFTDQESDDAEGDEW
jgi:hypothetical protein